MCLRRGESEDRLERRNRAKGHLDIDLEEFERRRSYFFACGEIDTRLKPDSYPRYQNTHQAVLRLVGEGLIIYYPIT